MTHHALLSVAHVAQGPSDVVDQRRFGFRKSKRFRRLQPLSASSSHYMSPRSGSPEKQPQRADATRRRWMRSGERIGNVLRLTLER